MTNEPKPSLNPDLGKVYTLFFESLHEDGIEPIIKIAYEIFHRPVLLTDENYRLLYQYPKRKLNQDIWDALYETGTLPLDTVWEYQKIFLTDKPAGIYEPFYADWGPAAEFPRILGEVYTRSKKILGHIAIFMMDSELQPNDLEITKIFIQALLIKMSHRHNNIMTNSGYLKDLLSPDTPAQLKTLACNILQKYLRGNFCLMVTPIGESAAQRAYATSAVNRLSTSYRDSISTIHDNCIVTLLGEMSSPIQTQKERLFLSRVASTLQQSYKYTGISNSFRDLSDIQVYYPQAYYTAMLQTKECCFYSDVIPNPAFALLMQHVPMRTFMHPVLDEIQYYDNIHATMYFETLKYYSLTLHNKDATANILCIHRNTLLYRLNRIQEIFDLPFEDTQIALSLLNSFQMWDVYNRNKTNASAEEN